MQAVFNWSQQHWVLLLVLLTLAALAVLWYHPRWWIRRDVADFNIDPADDTFHGKFHRQRTTWRAGFIAFAALVPATVTLLAPLTLTGHWWFISHTVLAHGGVFLLHFLAVGCLGGAYFFYHFNPGLNAGRKLAYVGPYYVSPDPAAAYFPDRYIWQKAVATFPTFDLVDEADLLRLRQDEAGDLFRKLMADVLKAGLGIFGLFILLEIILLFIF